MNQVSDVACDLKKSNEQGAEGPKLFLSDGELAKTAGIRIPKRLLQIDNRSELKEDRALLDVAQVSCPRVTSISNRLTFCTGLTIKVFTNYCIRS